MRSALDIQIGIDVIKAFWKSQSAADFADLYLEDRAMIRALEWALEERQCLCPSVASRRWIKADRLERQAAQAQKPQSRPE